MGGRQPGRGVCHSLPAGRELEAKNATLEGVQAAVSGLAGVAMGFPGALEELANLCRERGISRI